MQVSLIISATKPIHSRNENASLCGDWMALADTIMANVRTRLRNLGIQDQEFAKRVGVSPQVVSRWLNRKSAFEIRHVDKMAEVLGCLPEELARDPGDSVIPILSRDVDALLNELAHARGYDLVKRPFP